MHTSLRKHPTCLQSSPSQSADIQAAHLDHWHQVLHDWCGMTTLFLYKTWIQYYVNNQLQYSSKTKLEHFACREESFQYRIYNYVKCLWPLHVHKFFEIKSIMFSCRLRIEGNHHYVLLGRINHKLITCVKETVFITQLLKLKGKTQFSAGTSNLFLSKRAVPMQPWGVILMVCWATLRDTVSGELPAVWDQPTTTTSKSMHFYHNSAIMVMVSP